MPFFTRRMQKYLEKMEGKEKSSSKKHHHHKGEKKIKTSAVQSKFEDQLPEVTSPGSTGQSPVSTPASSPPSKSQSKGQVASRTASTPSVQGSTKTGATQETDLKKLKFLRDCIKAEVMRIRKSRGAIEPDRNFRKFTINQEENPIFEGETKKIYKAKHASYPQNTLICQLITSGEVNKDATMFKILRHIGKKHPNIIQTWDIYFQDNQIYIFQEFANHGSIATHVSSKGAVGEAQARQWAANIFKALDYLGDIGISHRAIAPKHVMLTTKNSIAKLTGFEQAVIYWDPDNEKIVNVSCISREEQAGQQTFNAPEVYGNPSEEEFDPLAADVWSFGATIFYAITGNYPYDVNLPGEQIDSDVKKNIESVNASEECKALLRKMLSADVDGRCSINDLYHDQWIRRKGS